MTEVKKYFVYKISGHYYTIDVKPVYEKVLFEGTEKECYEFVKKELEVFEKEAEENKPPYAYCSLNTNCELWKDGFQKGAEFGYKKGFEFGVKSNEKVNQIVDNEWHYVKDGVYPKDKETILALCIVGGKPYPYLAQYWKDNTKREKDGVDLNWICWRNNLQREVVEPYAWREIVPPKESE